MGNNILTQSPQTDKNQIFDDWLFITTLAIDSLLVWRSWLKAWQNHHLLGHIAPELFDVVLADMEKNGVGCIVNEKSTRPLRRVVTGVSNES